MGASGEGVVSRNVPKSRDCNPGPGLTNAVVAAPDRCPVNHPSLSTNRTREMTAPPEEYYWVRRCLPYPHSRGDECMVMAFG